DLVLYPKKAIISLPLQADEKYRFAIRSFRVSEYTTLRHTELDIEKEKEKKLKDILSGKKETISGEVKIQKLDKKSDIFTSREELEFMLPKNTYLGIFLQNPVTLYQDTQAPVFQILEHNSGKEQTSIKICRISNESYSVIEIYDKRNDSDFFQNGIDSIESIECFEKTFVFTGKEEQKVWKQKIDFHDVLGSPARSGLYTVFFSDEEDRSLGEKVQKPLFFGIIDSHIMMKISHNGEAFFFVNDFSGKPLSGQNIRVYQNNFTGKKRQWERTTSSYTEEVYSPGDQGVLGDAIFLGTTNEEGILQVDLGEKINEAYGSTFENNFNEQWKEEYPALFITSSSKEHLTYVNSTWNAGIAPWNFGYSVGSYSWKADADDMIQASEYIQKSPKYYSHTFTDRKLYLPGEHVYIKSIIREQKELQTASGAVLEILVRDPKNNTIHKEEKTIGEYGSAVSGFDLSGDTKLGTYKIELRIDGAIIGRSGFQVEVFKKPKFQNNITLDTIGLKGDFIKITETIEEKNK
ncbi:MAG: hypothetical protein GY828_05865, partial [Candidatus Gracilibacteria bacterium]|nr:hypothetical protein [Candidatus Gracilibacteria bacterium]